MITLRKDINILLDHFRYRKSLLYITLLVMFSINCDNPFIDEPKVRTINRLQSQCEDIKYDLERYHSNNASEKDLERLLRDQHELIRKEADLESDKRLGRNKMLEDLEDQYSADSDKQLDTIPATADKNQSTAPPMKKFQLPSSPRDDDGNVLIAAPDFTLANLDGEQISLGDLRGKVVLLNFWGTWCGPCKREIPDFINLIDKHGAKGLEIIGITLSSGSSKDIKKFANKRKINYTLLTDINGNETQGVKALYGQETGEEIKGIPTTFLIDKDGNIRKRYVGPRSEEVFFADLEPYI